MYQVRDMVKVTIKELKFNKVEPITEFEWELVNKYLLEACGK